VKTLVHWGRKRKIDLASPHGDATLSYKHFSLEKKTLMRRGGKNSNEKTKVKGPKSIWSSHAIMATGPYKDTPLPLFRKTVSERRGPGRKPGAVTKAGKNELR